ncbi:neutrophil cytosol factor 2-like [Sycon ciliatum]|uniref:neutrophil cytosol factor 2-like n=1 Tax=Sycon ciliatum TaxID=27933 RepID=UPI0020AAAC06|eukprot:scpid59744/ scgid0741/ Neutrophil cytosol factor 2; 67 kDa neutrophil oxidase factor; Neutrophil NADPH oxidase factor 2; p67-phox
MAVSLAETLTTWSDAIKAFEGGDARKALGLFKQCQDASAIMLFNIAVAHLKLKSYREAITGFDAAVKKDQHLAVAYFQRGIAHHYLNSDMDAVSDFDEAHHRMRGTRVIDYRQLGMPCKLYECDVLLNSAVTYAKLGRSSEAQDRVSDAQDAQIEKRHEQQCRDVSSAIRQGGRGCSIITMPDAALFRPAKQKVANIKKKNHLGDAKVLSSVIDQDQFAGFMGKKELEDGGSSPPVSRSPRIRSPRFGRRSDIQYRAIYSFEPNTNLEVALRVGDICVVKEKDADGWFTVTNISTSKSGLAPGSYLEPIEGSLSPSTSQKRKKSDQLKFLGVGKKSAGDDAHPVAEKKAAPMKALPVPGGPKRPAGGPPPKVQPPKSPGPTVAVKPKPPTAAKKHSDKVVIKLHMDHTRVLQVSNKITFDKLLSAVCKKFHQDDKSLSLWYMVGGELSQVERATDLCECWKQATVNKQHLTLWVYAAPCP